MTKVEMHGANDPLAGTYNVVLQDNPNKVIKTLEISSRVEFETTLQEINKYNINAPQEKKQILLRASIKQ